MKYQKFTYGNSEISYSVFRPDEAVGEIHALAKVRRGSFQEQLASVSDAIRNFLASSVAKDYSVAFARVILSDASNQANQAVSAIKKIVGNGAVSFVQQPPLDYSKIAVLLYLQEGADVQALDDYTSSVSRNGFTHYYTASVVSDIADTYAETGLQLSYLEKLLIDNNLNIADNCVRTWFFVQNIDVNYGAVVKARRENFDLNGLTVDTHYITSTGICGRHSSKDVTSILDAYSVGGLKPGQMNFLYASDHLNRTSDYGVTFERGTYVDYADRRHILISGTASIDNKGNIVAEGDIVAQTHRMIENVEALLAEGKSGVSDLAHIVCYLRDTADYPVVSEIFAEKFADVPYVITLAPVCRPGWLIEMECMAISGNKSAYGEF